MDSYEAVLREALDASIEARHELAMFEVDEPNAVQNRQSVIDKLVEKANELGQRMRGLAGDLGIASWTLSVGVPFGIQVSATWERDPPTGPTDDGEVTRWPRVAAGSHPYARLGNHRGDRLQQAPSQVRPSLLSRSRSSRTGLLGRC